ncbi:hypothetical protein ACNKHT_11770 [Shigella flexneri]
MAGIALTPPKFRNPISGTAGTCCRTTRKSHAVVR